VMIIVPIMIGNPNLFGRNEMKNLKKSSKCSIFSLEEVHEVHFVSMLLGYARTNDISRRTN
jgi:hypothetical protein